MQILTVELENVKSYEKATVTFSQGVNAIVGHNGAGKSTILEAIGFALFDTLPYSQNEFLRGGAKSARVRVSFVSSCDERVYDVERRIGSSAHYYVHDPQLETRICEGKADVVRFLREHLNVEPSADLSSIFKDAVGVPQGTLTAAFLLGTPDRKRIFESLLRVEEYSRVWEKLREPVNLLKSRKEDVRSEVSRLQGRLERLPVLEAEIAELKQNLSATDASLRRATQELDGVRALRDKLQTAHDAVHKAESALTEIELKLQGVEGRRQAAEEAHAEAEAAQKRVAENKAGYEAYLQAQQSKEQLETRVRQRRQVEDQRAKVDTNVALQEAEARRLQNELDAVAAAERVVAELQGAVLEQTRLEGELQTARQQQARSDDAKRAAAQQEEQLKRLQARRAELERQLEEAREVEERIATASAQIEALRSQRDARREVMTTLKSQADLINDQSQRLEDVQTTLCPLCEQPLTAAHRGEMLARNNSRLEEMRANYREASKQVQTLETSLQQEQAALKRWQDELLKLPRADEAKKVGEEVARTQVQFDQAQAQAASLAGAVQQVETAETALAALGNPRDRYNVASEQAKRRKEVESELAQNQKDRAATEAQLKKLEAALAEFGDLDAELAAVEAILQRHKDAHDTVLGNQRQADEVATRAQAAAALAQEVKTLRKECDELKRAYEEAAARFDEAAYTQANQRAEELQREAGVLRGELSTLEKNQESAERELAELRTLTAEVDAKEAKMKRFSEEEEVLETIRGKLRQAGPYISSALNRQISDGAQQIFCDLMQDYSRHLTWKEDYGITLEVDGRERTFSQLSGGEQMSAALSVRLALLREMSSIDIAFFDEPTANLDEVRRESLARQILNVRGFRQLFVISHDDTFQQATQNVVRVARVDGVSRVLAE
jgi:exonuclease SbcC